MIEAKLTVRANRDAEVTVLDAGFNRVGRDVGDFEGSLKLGLYKVKVNRGGAVRERLVELGPDGAWVGLYIQDFPSVAPVGLDGRAQQAVEGIARKARRRCDGPCLLFVGHWPGDAPSARPPFTGIRTFPWRATREAVDLARSCRDHAEAGGELWAAVAVPIEKRGDTFVLEMRKGAFVSRQAIPISSAWDTRVFLRGLPETAGEAAVPTDGPPCEVSIQMAKRRAPIVYWDHLETIEVARRALELGRQIFTSTSLIDDLLHGKFENPIAGMTGFHLLLDSLDAGTGLALDHPQRPLVDEVLVNLTGLLQPPRPRGSRLHADPAWAELPDMTALRLRAGRVLGQVEVSEPPLFKASWDAIKAHASREGLSWIGRDLWRRTGDANRLGPYVAWAPRINSARRTRDDIARRLAEFEGIALVEGSIGKSLMRTAPSDEPFDMAALAQAFQLPLSIVVEESKRAVSEQLVSPAPPLMGAS